MPDPIVLYYNAKKHDGTIEVNFEFVEVIENETEFVGKGEGGGETRFPKTIYLSVNPNGTFRPFMI